MTKEDRERIRQNLQSADPRIAPFTTIILQLLDEIDARERQIETMVHQDLDALRREGAGPW